MVQKSKRREDWNDNFEQERGSRRLRNNGRKPVRRQGVDYSEDNSDWDDETDDLQPYQPKKRRRR